MLTASLYAGHHSLVVPQIVIDETLAVYLRMMEESRDRERQAVERFRRLSGEYARVSLTKGLLTRTRDAYASALNQWLTDVNARVVPHGVIDTGILSIRAVEKRKPFDAQGRGLQDTLIWLAVLRLGETEGTLIALVTGNNRDFADTDGSLHHDLANEWTKVHGGDAPRLFDSLGEFVEAEVRPQLELVDELSIESQLNAGYMWERNVVQDVQGLVEMAEPHVNHKSVPVPPYASDLIIESLETVSSVRASDIRKLGEFDMVATLNLVAEAVLSFTLDKWDYEHFSSSDWPMIDVVHHEGDLAVCELFLEVEITADITIDASARRITAMQVRDVEAVRP